MTDKSNNASFNQEDIINEINNIKFNLISNHKKENDVNKIEYNSYSNIINNYTNYNNFINLNNDSYNKGVYDNIDIESIKSEILLYEKNLNLYSLPKLSSILSINTDIDNNSESKITHILCNDKESLIGILSFYKSIQIILLNVRKLQIITKIILLFIIY